MIQHIRILSIFPFVQMSKIHTRAPDFEMNRPPKWCFITWRLVSYAKPELILWLWEKIRKSWYACLHTVMFCHGWQNKAASSHGWLVVAGHVTPRKSNPDTLRLFLFSYNGTKINSGFAQDAIHKPTTHHLDGRHISQQTSICPAFSKTYIQKSHTAGSMSLN